MDKEYQMLLWGWRSCEQNSKPAVVRNPHKDLKEMVEFANIATGFGGIGGGAHKQYI